MTIDELIAENERLKDIHSGQALIIRNIRDELKRLQLVIKTGYVICGNCYLHGERPGKHEGPCIEEEVEKIKQQKDYL